MATGGGSVRATKSKLSFSVGLDSVLLIQCPKSILPTRQHKTATLRVTIFSLDFELFGPVGVAPRGGASGLRRRN